MRFEFVDNNAAISHTARRRIRSHAAMGRNVGKRLQRRSRSQVVGPGITLPGSPIGLPKSVGEIHETVSRDERVPTIERQVGDGLCGLHFKEPNPGSWDIVQKAFSFLSGPRHAPELSKALDNTGSSTSIWVQLMFLDEAYFHCAIAVSATAINNLVVKQEGPLEAIHHMSHTLRLINERLAGSDAVSDTNIAVVIIMTQYESLQRRRDLVHFEGLRQMIELRGGISQLTKQSPKIAAKVFRTDLEQSLQLGSSTRFSIEDIALGSTAVLGLPQKIKGQGSRNAAKGFDARFYRQFSVDLQELLIDITQFAQLLNDAHAARRPRVNVYAFHDTLLLLGYRLVHISPLGGPRPTICLENAVHLGLAAFIMTFLRGLDTQIMDIPLLCGLARSAARDLFSDDRETQKVLLWVAYIEGAAMLGRHDDTWLISKTGQIMRTLQLHTWEDARRILTGFPWVSAVHDKAGQRQASAVDQFDHTNHS